MELRAGAISRATPISLQFGMYTSEEIKNVSVAKIITPLSFNALGHPLSGGLYDPCLGPTDISAVCGTCSMKQTKCPGHIGYIDLPVRVINPLFHKAVANLLKMSCLECHKILLPNQVKALLVAQLTLISSGLVVEAQNLETMFGYTDENGKSSPVVIEEIKSYLKTMAIKNDTKEWRGEQDMRNLYLNTARSYVIKNKRCIFCEKYHKKVTTLKNKIMIPAKIEVADKFDKKKGDIKQTSHKFMTPDECKTHLSSIYDNDSDLVKSILPVTKSSIDCLFMDVVLVTPTNSRPISFVDGTIEEHPQNAIYKAIINDCLVIRSIIHLMNNGELSAERKEVLDSLLGTTNAEKFQLAWQELQTNVDTLLDVEMRNSRKHQGIGIKQIIEKKEGIIRMNMMGKRVNYAARTVITPDPNLNVDEIGVPEPFAKKLTFPVPVTVYNVSELRKLVLNGPDVHPGANFLEKEDGSITKLDAKDYVQRESVAKKLLTPGSVSGIKILHRHLINGDVMLLNRQPTLHRPSIMAHRARILKGEKTFRLHYANCKSYNADFDGDEMNAHFPQNHVARSEGYNLVSVCKNYLVPKDGTPLLGLIQDHVIAGVQLSVRGTFYTKDEYMHLVFQALSHQNGNIKLLKPAFYKPAVLWSGKQVISTVIINSVACKTMINLKSTAKIPAKAWGSSFMSEAEVVIRQGELLCGVLDKMHYGSTPYSLVHCVYELYGGETAIKLLSSFAKLFTACLQLNGFTLGVEDILVVKKADKSRKKIIHNVRNAGEPIVSKIIDMQSDNVTEIMEESHRKDLKFRALLDHTYKTSLDSFTNEINKVCLPAGLLKPFPRNNLQLMVQSGAKGSTVNTMQISCLLGQIELEGKRPPLMISGRSLPSFPPFEISPRAGGFVDGRFMTGIKPQEFFFHCMAGREGLIDTAVKTSRSGYLQRCLVKHLEGLSVRYDMTVRDSDGSVIQFLYGEDGMDVTKCQFLNEKQLSFLVENKDAIIDENLIELLKDSSDKKGLKSLAKAIRKYKKKGNSLLKKERSSPFLSFSREAVASLENETGIDKSIGRSYAAKRLSKIWRKMPNDEKERYSKINKPAPDPATSKFQPDRHFGSITEMLDTIMENYIKNHKTEISSDILKEMLHSKAQSSLCSPGEPVGLLAAQSIGEPSTQMTLNTFHFAGRGDMNVTLGIPRLREILMVASKNIKTPSMEIPFKTDISKLEKKADKLRRHLNRITMSDVLESIIVTEKLQLQHNRKLYKLRMQFLPHEAYKDMTYIKPKNILLHVEKKFLKQILVFAADKSKSKKSLIEFETEVNKNVTDIENEDGEGKDQAKKTSGRDDYESSEEEPENDDDDATTARRRARHNEEMQYSDMEEEDVDALNATTPATDQEKKEEEEEDVKEEESSSVVLKNFKNILEFKIDSVNHLWCEVTFAFPANKDIINLSTKLKDVASHSIITCIPGIKKAFIMTDTKGHKILKTDGINLKQMYNYDSLLDINRLYTNDIHQMTETYGIEAAAKVLVKEVQDVFKVYGITVDPRHLSLVADYMTFSGEFKAMNCKGMESSPSPLQQMSFESSLGFLRASVSRALKDDLTSPSARLMVGQPMAAGTTCFDLKYNMKI